MSLAQSVSLPGSQASISRTYRPETLAVRGMVAAPHYLAAQAGLDTLKAGGNAIDAAIATNATLQVVYPFVCGLGGDLFAIVWHAPSRTLIGLNASGRAPATATIERYHALGHASMPRHGIHSVTVPGCVSGWDMLSTRFGRLGLERALQPAISHATGGFPVGPGLHHALMRMNDLPLTTPSFRANYMPDGQIPTTGSLATAPWLGRTLSRIAQQGPDVFYRGEVAQRIADFFRAEGGLITEDDLASHQAEWVEPLSTPFGQMNVLELPPNTQGITALQMLGIMDGLELGSDLLSPETVHAGAEAKKLAFADRDKYITDIERMRVRPEALLDSEYLRQRRELIDPGHASVSVDPGSFSGDTVYMCAVDADGSAVSLIQSNYSGFGSGLVVEGTGISLQNRGAYFSLDPEAANALAPGKRTLHTLIPSMALQQGRPAVVFGTMGGDGQPQTHTQVYTGLLKYGLNIQAAIEAPRWVHGTEHMGAPEILRLESRFPQETAEALQALGHHVEMVDMLDSGMGHACGIVIDEANGILRGGADPRSEGAALGW